MTQDRVDMYIMTNQKYLPAEKIVFIKQKLLDAVEFCPVAVPALS